MRGRAGADPAGQVASTMPGGPAFVAMLEYKAARYGRVFGKIGRFEPTSQVCSACGVKDGPKPLHVRAVEMHGMRHRPRPGLNAAEEHTRPGTQGEDKMPVETVSKTRDGPRSRR